MYEPHTLSSWREIEVRRTELGVYRAAITEYRHTSADDVDQTTVWTRDYRTETAANHGARRELARLGGLA